MIPLLRKDGEWKLYRVEIYLNEKWTDAVGYYKLYKNIPLTEIWVNPPGYDGKRKEPLQSFTASGQCWQEIGLYGSYDIEIAQNLCYLLAKYNHGQKFRVVEHIVSQHRKELIVIGF